MVDSRYAWMAQQNCMKVNQMRRPKVKLDNLIAFITVAEKHDIDDAAEVLRLSPPGSASSSTSLKIPSVSTCLKRSGVASFSTRTVNSSMKTP